MTKLISTKQDEYEKLWEEEVWRLYYALSRSVEVEGLPLLDKLKFLDFAAFCRKYTSTAVANAGKEKALEIMYDADPDIVLYDPVSDNDEEMATA